jgi:hypothetical protein
MILSKLLLILSGHLFMPSLSEVVTDRARILVGFEAVFGVLLVGLFLNAAANKSRPKSEWPEFISEVVGTDIVQLDLSAQETAHIMLANSYRYQDFQNRFHEIDLFECLTDFIQQQDVEPRLKTEIYFSRLCI